MALEKTHTIYGAEVSGYYRVADIDVVYRNFHGEADLDEFFCRFRVEALNGPNGAHMMGNEEANGNTTYHFVPSGTLTSGIVSLPEACYNYLKSLDTFSDATDH
tara:strand:+ start:63 stop:374 length:312 start_codon:yes stop_codon:yes gene_type:complete